MSERNFQNHIIDKLIKNNNYIVRTNSDFSLRDGLDINTFKFYLLDTHLDILRRISYNDDISFNKVYRYVVKEIAERGYIDVIKHGIKINCLFEHKTEDNRIYFINIIDTKTPSNNIMSVIPEFNYSTNDFQSKDRIDLAIFINGFPVVAIELKLTSTGQTYQDAIKQWRNHRNPTNNPVLQTDKGFIVYMAMDDNECHMTTKLNNMYTYFLPFNQGSNGGGQEGTAGNPIVYGDFKTSYIWNNILTATTLVDIIYNFCYINTDINGNKTIIFPRYHQYDVVNKLKKECTLGSNYLIQHSTGSGKSLSIAWLAFALSFLKDANTGKEIFSSVIVVVDRIVLVKQLYKDLDNYNTQFVKEAESSADLINLINKKQRIIVTTIQKFGAIKLDNLVKQVKNVNYAVIADEAHSGETGKNQSSLVEGIGVDIEDDIDRTVDSFKHLRGVPNISFFAFTATPSKEAINIFGTENLQTGTKESYHVYSMKQAVTEGFIIDVLGKDNFYSKNIIRHIDVLKNGNEVVDRNKMRQLIENAITNKEANNLVVNEIIPDYINQVLNNSIKCFKQINGIDVPDDKLRCMVVCCSRQHAFAIYNLIVDKLKQMKQEFTESKEFIQRIVPMIAFSGTLEKQLENDESIKYTEQSMNSKYFSENNIQINGRYVASISEKETANIFKQIPYSILVVASKFQTGFDDKYLGCMYVLKSMHDRQIVQTYSRLNRACKTQLETMSKKPRIIDFVNDPDDILNAYSTYYTSTKLSSGVDISKLFDYYTELTINNLIHNTEQKLLCRMYDSGIKDEVNLSVLANRINERIKDIETSGDSEISFYIGRYFSNYSKITRFMDITLLARSRNIEVNNMENLWKSLYMIRNFLRKEDNSLIISDDSLEVDDTKLVDIKLAKSISEMLNEANSRIQNNINLSNESNNLSSVDKTIAEFIAEYNLRYNMVFNSNAEIKKFARDIEDKAREFIRKYGDGAKTTDDHFELNLTRFVQSIDRIMGFHIISKRTPENMIEKMRTSIESEEDKAHFLRNITTILREVVKEIEAEEALGNNF